MGGKEKEELRGFRFFRFSLQHSDFLGVGWEGGRGLCQTAYLGYPLGSDFLFFLAPS